MATAEANLEFKIRADSSQGQAELARFRQKVGSDLNVIKGEFGGTGAAIRREMADVAQSLAANTGAVGRMAGAFGSAGLVMGAAAGGAVALGGAIFSAANAAAAAGEKFDDLAGKTGLSVETLSGLSLQLKQSESSLDGFANAMFFLTKNQAAARDGSAELQSAFNRLGVDIEAGPEEAIRRTIKGLAEMTDVGERNRVGAQVLGRAYRELAIFINDTEGDLDKIIETSRKAGRVMTEEAARAAAKYKDDLDELGAQLEVLERDFGGRFIPAISRGMKGLSTILQTNADDWGKWGMAVRLAQEAASLGLPGVPGFDSLSRKGVKDVLFPQGKRPDPVAEEESRSREFDAGNAVAVKRGNLGQPVDPAGVTIGKAERAREQAEKDAARKREQARKGELREIEKDEETKEKIYRRAIDKILDWSRDLQREAKEAREESKRADKEWADRVADASDAVRKALLGEIAILTDENTHLTEINNTITRAEVLGAIDERTAAFLRQLAAVNAIADQMKNIQPVGGLADVPQARGQEKGPVVIEDVGTPPPPNLDPWRQAISGLKEMAVGSFGQIGKAMGTAAAAAFVYGQSFSKAMKQALAASFAAIAAESLVQAIVNTAKGFAALAGFYPGSAALYFKAAALWGAAGIAAGAGGALFSGGTGQGSAFGGGGESFGGGGFGSSSSQSNEPRVVEQSRNTQQQQVIILRVESRDSHIVEVIEKDARANGPTRNLIIEMAAA